jgi:hypothetical protein
VEHDCRLEIFKINRVFDPKQIVDQEMVQGLQLVSLYHNNFLVILNFFTGSNYEVLQEISAQVFLHNIYHFTDLWAWYQKLDRI